MTQKPVLGDVLILGYYDILQQPQDQSHHQNNRVVMSVMLFWGQLMGSAFLNIYLHLYLAVLLRAASH